MTLDNPVLDNPTPLGEVSKPSNRPIPNMLPESVLSDLSNTARTNQSNNQSAVKKPPVTPSRQHPTIPKPFNFQTAKRSTTQTTSQPITQPINQTINRSTQLPTLRSAVINPITPHRPVPKFNQSIHQLTPLTNLPNNLTVSQLPGSLTINRSIDQPIFPTAAQEDFCEDASSLAAILNPQPSNQLDPVQLADRLSIATKRRANIDRGSIYGGAGRVICRSQTQTQTPNRRATMLTSSNRPIGLSSAFNSHYSTPARRAPQTALNTPVSKPRPVRTNENIRAFK